MAAMDTQNRAMCLNVIPSLPPVIQDKVKVVLKLCVNSYRGRLELNWGAFNSSAAVLNLASVCSTEQKRC